MDPSQLSPEQQRYFAEAAKRKRADGLAQFQELHYSKDSRLRGLTADHFADHAALDALPPRLEPGAAVKIVVFGAGIGGILAAVRLVQQGFAPAQIRIIEAAGGIGGTWYWNRYPGVHCDCESYVYMPLLEETGYMPSQKYASGVEIRRYLEAVVKKWGLEESIVYRTEIKSLQWEDGSSSWRLDLVQGRGPGGKEEHTFWANAEFVVFTIGVFPRPQVPKLAGLVGFEGSMFHTARWDYDVTGGSSDEVFPVLDKLEGKRVGIIGTGASAIQSIPELAKYAKEVFVFQRTPSQVYARNQKDTNPTEWKEQITAKKGWQQDRMENLSGLLASGVPADQPNLVDDEWSKMKTYRALVGGDGFDSIATEKISEHIGTLLAADAEQSAAVRARVSEIVKDPETASRLTPWYPTWCKRPTFSDTYLQAFNQPNVHLVDTDGKGVESITPKGVVANGKEYPIDVLVLSTGYRSPSAGGVNPSVRAGVEVVGRNGRTLTQKWEAQGATTYHGSVSNGFPNLFLCGPSQGAATGNFAEPLDQFSKHNAWIIASAHARSGGGTNASGIVIEPSVEAEDAYSMRIMSGAAYASALAICTPGYLTAEGDFTSIQDPMEQMKMARAGCWPAGMVAWSRMLEEYRKSDAMEGYQISSPAAA